VCATNGGLYIKLGQAVTTMAHVLPPEFMTYFSALHDQAPQASHSEVQICSSTPHLGDFPSDDRPVGDADNKGGLWRRAT